MHIMQIEERRARIKQLLRSDPSVTQEQLAERLHRDGFEVTQSTLSRDLAELGAVKRKGIYQLPSDDPLRLAGFRSAHPAGDNLIVIKTEIGSANRVALALDNSNLSEIVGTVAGDDTLFVAVHGASAQSSLLEYFKQI